MSQTLKLPDEKQMVKIICRSCGTDVAATDGEQVFFDGKPFPLRPNYLNFVCPNCHQNIEWRRENKAAVG